MTVDVKITLTHTDTYIYIYIYIVYQLNEFCEDLINRSFVVTLFGIVYAYTSPHCSRIHESTTPPEILSSGELAHPDDPVLKQN